MTLLALLFLLALLPAGSAKSRHLPKASISSPVFGPRQVHGVLGGSVTVKCFYPPTSVNRHDRKYWCKESGSRCVTMVSTNYVAPSYQDRVSLTDHPEAENFQINISALGLEDSGSYQCGLGVNGRGLSYRVTLTVAEAPPVPEAAELFYVKLRSTWTVSCNFGPETADMKRYLCKKDKEGCRTIVNSYQEIDDAFKGRALLTFEEPLGSFSVTMTQMDWEDTGLYYCGTGEYGSGGKSKELDVFIYEDKNFPQLKTTVTGIKGSSATFECLYDPLKKSTTRIWCKWRVQGCDKIIDNTGYVKYSYEGRVAMFENPGNKTVTVILNQLEAKDQGFYWCMSNEQKEQQSSTELKVVDGEPGLTGKKEVEAPVGSRLGLTCSYPCKYYSYEKYWCKWNYTGCPVLPAQDQGLPGPSATCNTSNKTVVLSFDPVTEEDEGWYWCGVKRNGLFGEVMAVQLRVAAGNDARHSPELLDVGDSSPESGAAPPGGAYSDAEVRKGAAPESSDESHGSNTLALVLGPLAGLILIVVTAFAIVKYRQMKRSDLVSVGSYRTNISMSDFESVRDYSASNSACVKDSQETPMGQDEFITTTDTLESAADAKKAKRSSKEDADLAYSSFLVTSDSIAQDSSRGDSTVLDVSPKQDQV
ncbi:polymeric immunoglobulin receptor [Corvus kubaryi]|uniref:polymeric immunoglobulin receptor n=1 Tax=Corvus kubaryi TaxID=68294 RepID=UPI001C03A6F6|nr:polymeric immunoglobulin receptor [Corvus kubaryi]